MARSVRPLRVQAAQSQQLPAGQQAVLFKSPFLAFIQRGREQPAQASADASQARPSPKSSARAEARLFASRSPSSRRERSESPGPGIRLRERSEVEFERDYLQGVERPSPASIDSFNSKSSVASDDPPQHLTHQQRANLGFSGSSRPPKAKAEPTTTAAKSAGRRVVLEPPINRPPPPPPPSRRDRRDRSRSHRRYIRTARGWGLAAADELSDEEGPFDPED